MIMCGTEGKQVKKDMDQGLHSTFSLPEEDLLSGLIGTWEEKNKKPLQGGLP